MRDVLDAGGFVESGWECDDDGTVFVCPHGEPVEPDGECPDGCRSPLLQMGFV